MAGAQRVVGLLLKSTDVITESDLRRLCPSAICIHSTRVRLDPGEGLESLASKVEEASEVIMDCAPELIAFACASATFSGGSALDSALSKRVRQITGCNVVTAAGALVAAARRLRMSRVLLVSPYSEAIDRAVVAMLAEVEIEVASVLSLRYSDIFQADFLSGFPGAKNRLVDPSWLHRLALDRLAGLPGVNGIVIACTGLRVSEVIADIERDSKLPVVAANQSLAAGVQRELGLGIPVPGYGRLLEAL